MDGRVAGGMVAAGRGLVRGVLRENGVIVGVCVKGVA